jgi:multiple sugar transport system permease protein
MKNRTFFWFILPSLVAMILFIALPIGSVFIQSLYIEHGAVLKEVKSCGPFGCKEEVQIDIAATSQLKEEKPLGKFNGFGTYTNRNHLAINEVKDAWNGSANWSNYFNQIYNLPFYRALAFTLTYTFIVTPLVLLLGFFIALGVNNLPKNIKGPTIFVSLLPMIVTPLIGSLILFWMIDSKGILGASLQWLLNDPNLSLKASPTLTWIMLIIYGVWHSVPFAFIVFYAGLQTVPSETIEAAMIDGATRWERTRYVVLPHLVPLIVFISLIQLMDNFRVFEPIVGFSAQASATSLSWIIYNDLAGGEGTFFGSAGATSVLTILGVAVLLIPVLIRTWKDFNRKVV